MKTMFAFLLLVATMAGCGAEATDCSRSTDCFKGEVCAQGVCVPETAATGTNNSTNGNTDPNSPTPNPGYPELPENSLISFPDIACVVEPFDAVCHSPDDNDTFSERFVTSAVGCKRGDVLTPLNETRSMQLCSRELRDRFTQDHVECDTKSFVIEVIFTPKVECDRRVFKTSVNIAGNNCEEPNANIKCEDLPNGGLKVTGIVPPGRSLSSSSFSVEALYPNRIQFDYDLQWIVRE